MKKYGSASWSVGWPRRFGATHLAVLDGGVPVLDAQRVAEDGVVGVGDVAGRVDVVGAGAQPRVGADAVVDGESRGLGEADVGGRADADEEAVDGDGLAVDLDLGTVRRAADARRA